MKLELIVAGTLASAVVLGEPVWKVVYEKDGATNAVVAAAQGDLRVETTVAGDAWRGRLVNDLPGARVVSLEVMFDPVKLDTSRDVFYVPWEEGMRITRWPVVGEQAAQFSDDTLRREFDKEFNGNETFFAPTRPGLYEIDDRLVCPSERGTMQWMTLNDGMRGWYLGAHDPRHTPKNLLGRYDARAKTLALGVRFLINVGTGREFVISPVAFSAYQGTWHVAARRYRAWWNRCFTMSRVPDRVKDMTGVFIVLLKQQNDEIIWPYTEFDSLGRCAKSYGFEHVEFHAWGKGGHDRLYPEYDPDPLMGGREGLIRGVKTLRAMGIHATVYANGQLQEREVTKYWREKGNGDAIMRRDGTPKTEFWHKFKNRPGHCFDVVCPAAPNWYDQMLKICRDARDYGFEGFFYDQIGVHRPEPCYSTQHRHLPGDWMFGEDRRLLFKRIADAIHSEDPDFVLASEGYHDAIFDSCAWFEGWCDGNIWDRFDKKRMGSFFPEMTLYTFPEVVATERSYTPCYDRRKMNAAAAVNCRVNFAIRYRIDREYVEKGTVPKPEQTEQMLSPTNWKLMADSDWAGNRAYDKCVSDFRRLHREILLRGVFRADEGFSVEMAGRHVANRWTGTDGSEGILVWNDEATPQTVRMSFPGDLVGAFEPEAGEVDPSTPIPAQSLRLYRFK